MANKITKANGHIVQSDWAQTDETKMDYIHNKPENLTTVTVGGEPVQTFDADNYVKKIIGNTSLAVVPVINGDLTQTFAYIQNNKAQSYSNYIPRYYTSSYDVESQTVNGVLLTKDPTKDFHAANKKYVDTVANNLSFSTDLTETTVALSMISNTEYHDTNPVESLTIESFTAGTQGVADQWSIIFTAGSTISVTHPDTVKWALATPIFDPNKTYWLSFIPFGGNYLGTWTVVE